MYSQNWDLVQHQLAGFEIAADRGGHVLPRSPCRTRSDSGSNFLSGFIFDILNGWDTLMALPLEQKIRELNDPVMRAEWNNKAQTTEGAMRSIGNWAGYIFLETFSPESAPYTGRIVGG